jgi:hypothetical protein
MTILSQKNIEQFWGKVDKEISTIFYNGTRCWEWTGSSRGSGYGQASMGSRQRQYFSHRLSYEITFGNIPDGLFVLHHCDNRLCCNPEHLFLGTHKDNMQDMVRKGRHADFRGELHPQHKLSNAQVSEIQLKYSSGTITHRQLAKEYGVWCSSIFYIVNRKRENS